MIGKKIAEKQTEVSKLNITGLSILQTMAAPMQIHAICHVNQNRHRMTRVKIRSVLMFYM